MSQEFWRHALDNRIAKGAGGKGPRQKMSKIVKKCQKVFRHFSTIFAQGKKHQKSSKSVKKFSDTFRQFSRGTILPAPFGGALTLDNRASFREGGVRKRGGLFTRVRGTMSVEYQNRCNICVTVRRRCAGGRTSSYRHPQRHAIVVPLG